MLRRVEKATRLLSRQALPRPARLYSTPTKKASAPALATAESPKIEFPSFIVHRGGPAPSPKDENRILNDLERFLVRDHQYTVLPPPPPVDTPSSGETWYTDTLTQESMSIMDACLHNLYDVPRAKIIFEKLRQNETKSLLETGMYNAFIEAYYGMAIHKDRENSTQWLDDIHGLYQVLESEVENTAPNKVTYGLMLRAWQHFNRDSAPGRSSSRVNLPSPTQLLEKMHRRQISPLRVVAESVFDSHLEATEAIKTFSQAAVNLNIPEVIAEIGEAQALVVSEDALKDVPEVMPVIRPAKYDGEGKTVSEPEVPFNIAQLRRHLVEINQTRRVLPEDVMARQRHLEKSAYDVALERLQQQSQTLETLGIHNPALNSSTLQGWMWGWHLKLRERIKEEIQVISEEESRRQRWKNGRTLGSPETLAPYLNLVNPERLSLITIMEIMRLQGSSGLSDGMKTTRALISVGKAVEQEHKAQVIKKHNVYKEPPPLEQPQGAVSADNAAGSGSPDVDWYSQFGYESLKEKRLAVSKELEGEEHGIGWSQVTRSRIGGILVDCLMEVAEVERTAKLDNGEVVSEMQPAFHHAYEYLRGSKLGVIRLNPVVSERLALDPVKDTLHPRHLPMLVKPQPWVSHNVGGYLYSKTHVMRFKDSVEQQIYLKEASKHGQIELVYAGLDVLASTPWRINKKVFDVVLRTWNSGERLGKMPPATYDHPEPDQPEAGQMGDMKARSAYLTRLKAYNQAKANNHSDRCSVNYKLEIARALLNDAFYFPHNLDFRGRAYPVPAHLNHIGDDLCRGLLTFAEAKPLGARGLRWLKIHIANLYGYDKANFDDRVRWVDEHLDQIYQTATRLLDDPATKEWWLEASDPWQFLAASIELRDALESGNPEAFESSLPVHQDGTCNGLQHYAALGGDVQGARQVNLEASDKPSDVYSYVGAMVEEVIAKDCEKGEKYALMLKGKITRKVVKQTVMTTVYGVTFIGARDQIEKQLKDRKDIPGEECWLAAAYLARVVLGCIGNLFKGAQSIQTWLNLSARLIAKSIPEARIPELMAECLESPDERTKRLAATQTSGKSRASKAAAAKKGQLPMNRIKKELMTSVIWTTPLGLPIVQPYRKIARKQINTSIQTVYISDPNKLAEVNSVKQASAFPPNYIHSLDATHMMLTALECRKKRLTFASVHDSYWTHAADIDEMSSTIRDTFIALHSSDVLKKLRHEFLKRYQNYKIPLLHLNGKSLTTKLYNAGSRIYATPEQAKSLAALKDLLVVSEDLTSTVDESRAPKDAKTVKQLLNELEAEAGQSGSKKKKTRDEDEEYDEAEEDEDDVTHRTKATKEKKSQQMDAVVKLMGKFVNMTDLLPPLPEKGEFNVEMIKQSQYFFS